jgi:hypothetical protein
MELVDLTGVDPMQNDQTIATQQIDNVQVVSGCSTAGDRGCVFADKGGCQRQVR